MMDGTFETTYTTPSVKTEERWGREDTVGGRQGPNDNYRSRRSPGKSSASKITKLPNLLQCSHPILSYSSSLSLSHDKSTQRILLHCQKLLFTFFAK